MSTALLVIDVQRSLLDEEPWEKERLLENITTLLELARSSGTLVVFVCDTRVEPDGALDASLDGNPGDLFISKSFSDSFLCTSLHDQLQRAGVNKLIVCGMQTDYCIDTTCRRAASLGYEVQLISDAHSTFDHEFLPASQIVSHHNRILHRFPAGSGSVRTVPLADADFS